MLTLLVKIFFAVAGCRPFTMLLYRYGHLQQGSPSMYLLLLTAARLGWIHIELQLWQKLSMLDLRAACEAMM